MTDLRKTARGQACQVRLPGCHWGGETVVLAHIRRPGTGMGRKPPDTEGVFACWRCHDLMDGRQRDPAISRDDIKEAVAKGHERTLAIWREMGVL